MRSLREKAVFILSLILPVHSPVQAQVTSPTADRVVLTQYKVQPVQDQVFIFCPGPGGAEKTGTLTATPQSGPAGWDFEWSRLDTISFSYVPFLTQTGVPVSTAGNLPTGGYRVRITDGNAVTSTFYAWVYVRNMVVDAFLLNKTCLQLAFKGTINHDRLRYWDPGDQSLLLLATSLKYQWNALPDFSFYKVVSQVLVSEDFPSADTDLALTVTDDFGCSQQAGFFLESIYPKADFQISFERDDNNRASAPLEVSFANNSVNAVQYHWFFDDGADTVSNTLLEPDRHVYYIKEECKDLFSRPCNYNITLFATSEEGCVDSVSVPLQVSGSDLNIPNVFTPDEDGTNDRFFIDNVSLRVLHVQVFNRNGRKVYDFLGDETNLPDWKGWDGKILDTGQDASPGIYYYMISAYGWDDLEYLGRKYRGTVYLFREK